MLIAFREMNFLNIFFQDLKNVLELIDSECDTITRKWFPPFSVCVLNGGIWMWEKKF